MNNAQKNIAVNEHYKPLQANIEFHKHRLQMALDCQSVSIGWFFKIITGYFAFLYGILSISDKLNAVFGPYGQLIVLSLCFFSSLIIFFLGIMAVPNLKSLDALICNAQDELDKTLFEQIEKQSDVKEYTEALKAKYDKDFLYNSHFHIIALIVGIVILALSVCILTFSKLGDLNIPDLKGFIFWGCLIVFIVGFGLTAWFIRSHTDACKWWEKNFNEKNKTWHEYLEKTNGKT
ncbi:MAG: hypothetical protein HEQ32_02275 [Vampirovibrio sp.]